MEDKGKSRLKIGNREQEDLTNSTQLDSKRHTDHQRIARLGSKDGSDILNGFARPYRPRLNPHVETLMSVLRAALLAAVAVAVVPAAAYADGSAAAPSHVRVAYDQSTVIRLDRPAKTVLVGNPLVADALLVNDRTVYVLGRLFGNTNVIAVDGNGAEILNTQVTVGAPNVAQVTLYRGALGQRNLACAPHCERTLTAGDSEHEEIYQHQDHKVDVSAKSAVLATGAKE
jgi:Pilus formation protein N terminal region